MQAISERGPGFVDPYSARGGEGCVMDGRSGVGVRRGCILKRETRACGPDATATASCAVR